MDEEIDLTPVVRQRLAWDICDCQEIDDLWEELGLIPPGEDVAEAAHHESHERMATVAPLITLGDVYVLLTSDIISRIMKHHFEKSGGEMTDAMKSIMAAQNQEVIRGAIYPILAHMLESGVIQFGPAAHSSPVVRLM